MQEDKDKQKELMHVIEMRFAYNYPRWSTPKEQAQAFIPIYQTELRESSDKQLKSLIMKKFQNAADTIYEALVEKRAADKIKEKEQEQTNATLT